MGAADPYFVANSTRFLLLSLLHKPEVVGCDGGDRPTESERKQYKDQRYYMYIARNANKRRKKRIRTQHRVKNFEGTRIQVAI